MLMQESIEYDCLKSHKNVFSSSSYLPQIMWDNSLVFTLYFSSYFLHFSLSVLGVEDFLDYLLSSGGESVSVQVNQIESLVQNCCNCI